ncbi:MAG: hypothetical protein O2960_29655 [Verrucomicrobia bacterium]|nr:hypothetical protein [Verrucomicrobiota bacterium]
MLGNRKLEFRQEDNESVCEKRKDHQESNLKRGDLWPITKDAAKQSFPSRTMEWVATVRAIIIGADVGMSATVTFNIETGAALGTVVGSSGIAVAAFGATEIKFFCGFLFLQVFHALQRIRSSSKSCALKLCMVSLGKPISIVNVKIPKCLDPRHHNRDMHPTMPISAVILEPFLRADRYRNTSQMSICFTL